MTLGKQVAKVANFYTAYLLEDNVWLYVYENLIKESYSIFSERSNKIFIQRQYPRCNFVKSKGFDQPNDQDDINYDSLEEALEDYFSYVQDEN